MTATTFTYDGISSEVYNLVIGSFSGAEDDSQEMGNVEMTTVKAPRGNRFLKANATYNQQLVIQFSIMKLNCNDLNDYTFDAREIGFISRWLARKDYHVLHFNQGSDDEKDGWKYLFYNAILKLTQRMMGGKCVGFDVVATCDAPWGYDQKQTTTITTTPSPDAPSYSGTVNLYDDSDEIGILYPTLEIDVNGSGTISIYNEMTNTNTVIRNCVSGEHITMTNFSIESSECIPDDEGATYSYKGAHPTLYDDFNYVWMPVANYFVPENMSDERVNNITVTGNCTVSFSWNAPRKAVV